MRTANEVPAFDGQEPETMQTILAVTEMLGVDAATVFGRLNDWASCYQGGNLWSGYDCYLTGAEKVLGLKLPSHEKYRTYEAAAKVGGFRYVHEKFCLVTDFPDEIHRDADNQPHREDGPSHAWRDGWKLWYIDGIAVDEQIVMHPETQTISQIERETNSDVKAIRIARFGWARYLEEIKAEVVDEYENIIEGGTWETVFRLPDGNHVFVVTCASARLFAMGLPAGIETCADARRWRERGRNIQVVGRT